MRRPMLTVPKSAHAHSIKSRVVPKSALARERINVTKKVTESKNIEGIWYAVVIPYSGKFSWLIKQSRNFPPTKINSVRLFSVHAHHVQVNIGGVTR